MLLDISRTAAEVATRGRIDLAKRQGQVGLRQRELQTRWRSPFCAADAALPKIQSYLRMHTHTQGVI